MTAKRTAGDDRWIAAAAEQYIKACEKGTRIQVRCAYDVLYAAIATGERLDLDALIDARAIVATPGHEEVL